MNFSDEQKDSIWEQATQEKFRKMMQKIPIFLRAIAEKKVSQKAEEIVRSQNLLQITEKEMVDAFFAETPFGFHGPMKCDMEEIGIDYAKYGYKR